MRVSVPGTSVGHMEIQFVAGFGPIGPDASQTHQFWSGVMGIDFEQIAPDYFHARGLPGTKVFGLWPLYQAAEATFGSPEWPANVPTPQAWIEFELGSAEEVAAGARELEALGQTMLTQARQEPWGQTTARLLSPEGLLVGLSYMPQFHE